MIDRSSTLTVDSFCIAIGPDSIGLPTVRSLDTLLSSYLELVGRVRSDDSGELRAEDIAALSEATGLAPSVVENRLRSLVTV